MDIIIRNGRVIDAFNKIDKKLDLGINNGKILEIGDLSDSKATKEIDAEGCIVIPGLIDFHAHVYPLTEMGIPAESTCFSSGITTIVDAGSTGASNYEHHRGFISNSKLRIKCYLNVCSAGLVTDSYHENVNPKYFKKDRIKRLFEKYGGDILGLKIRQSKEIVGNMNIEPLKEAIKLAEEIGVNVVVHSTNPPVEMIELVKVLRKGDVITHSFHGIGNTIINSDGNVYDEIKEAQRSGVIFDVANARFHFAFRVAEAALKDGFLPDVISTDLTVKSLYKKPQAFNMMFLLSKYLNLGLSLNQIVERTTIKPAKIMNMEKIIGTLSKNNCADIAIIKEIKKDVVFEDWEGGKLKGNRLLRNMATIREGEIVFRDIEI